MAEPDSLDRALGRAGWIFFWVFLTNLIAAIVVYAITSYQNPHPPLGIVVWGITTAALYGIFMLGGFAMILIDVHTWTKKATR